MKKCPVGGVGTVDARIPFSQSVAWGPTMEMSPLLGSRVVDGPALTRDATAGGNLGMVKASWKVIPTPSAEARNAMAVRNGGQSDDRVIQLKSEQPSLPLQTCISLHFLAMSATCEPLLEALKDCLMRSDCVLKKGKLPSECLRQHMDELPDSCKSLRHAVFECKRGLVRTLKFHRVCYGMVDGAVHTGRHEETIQGKPSGHHGEW